MIIMKAFILSSNKSVILMSVAITITVIVDERIGFYNI